jgi:hypothetical protein
MPKASPKASPNCKTSPSLDLTSPPVPILSEVIKSRTGSVPTTLSRQPVQQLQLQSRATSDGRANIDRGHGKQDTSTQQNEKERVLPRISLEEMFNLEAGGKENAVSKAGQCQSAWQLACVRMYMSGANHDHQSMR